MVRVILLILFAVILSICAACFVYGAYLYAFNKKARINKIKKNIKLGIDNDMPLVTYDDLKLAMLEEKYLKPNRKRISLHDA